MLFYERYRLGVVCVVRFSFFIFFRFSFFYETEQIFHCYEINYFDETQETET